MEDFKLTGLLIYWSKIILYRLLIIQGKIHTLIYIRFIVEEKLHVLNFKLFKRVQ